MNFEYDENKSQSNKTKHGIDFEEAQALFAQQPLSIERAKTVDEEERYILVARMHTKCYALIFTFRKRTIRIISVRRCRKNEEKRIHDD